MFLVSPKIALRYRMTPVTHALLPLLLGPRFLPRRADGAPSWAASGAVAFAGVLPDLLSPHLGLEARHAAFSHSLVAWALFVLLLAAVSLHPRLRAHRVLLAICAGAYLAHLLCDLVTGGVPLLAPFEPAIWGEAWLQCCPT